MHLEIMANLLCHSIKQMIFFYFLVQRYNKTCRGGNSEFCLRVSGNKTHSFPWGLSLLLIENHSSTTLLLGPAIAQHFSVCLCTCR